MVRFIVTGASGRVGQLLVPRLQAAGVDLLLIGRSQAKLREIYPWANVATLGMVGAYDAGPSYLVHLAAVNNDAGVNAESFREGNLAYLAKTISVAKSANVAKFYLISSTHVLEDFDQSEYAKTKRFGEHLLKDAVGLASDVIYLPAVYGEYFIGRLAVLNRLPLWARTLFFPVLSATRPVVHVEKLAAHILADCNNSTKEDEACILFEDKESNPVYFTTKRGLDLAFAILGLVLFSWAILIVYLLIRIDSKGSGFFIQERVGQNGKLFKLYKFRTMQQGTEQVGTHEVKASQITRIGRWLRRIKLDEVPQLVNVVRNEMSLVGPRPCLPTQMRVLEERAKRGVLAIKPGVTGLSQVEGVDMSMPLEIAQFDFRYKALRSLTCDLHLILRTACGGGGGDPATKAA